jgi:multiple sugar transport system permease protein
MRIAFAASRRDLHTFRDLNGASMRSITRTPPRVVLLFLLPGLIGFAVFLAFPLVMAIGMSFTNYSGGPRFRFVGLLNYLRAFSNPDFINSLAVTGRFTLWTVAAQLFLGLAFALLLNKSFHGRDLFRGIFFLPNVLSSIAVGLAFMLLLNPQRGPVNQALAAMGVKPPLWLASRSTALATVIMVAVWQSFGYYMVLFLGGLQSIDAALYEAASIDGAGPVRKFLNVTLPGLTPVTFFAFTIAVINAFKVFDQVYMMTGGQLGGGPAGATDVLVFDIYVNAFTNLRFGYASAESVVLLAIVLTVTIAQNRGQRKWVSYDVI